MSLSGHLIISAAPYKLWYQERHVDSQKVVSIPLDGKYAAETFFTNARYGELCLSYKTDLEAVYSAKSLAANFYTVLSVQGDQAIELMRSDKPIIFPFITPSRDKIVFIGPTNLEKHEYHLYQYRMTDQTISRVSALPVVCWSKPIFSPDGRIIFSAVNEYHKDRNGKGNILWATATIVEIGANGAETKLASGIFPTWLEEGRSFFFFDNIARQLKLYNPTKQERITVIKDKVRMMNHPALSPDKKFLAFYGIIVGPEAHFGGFLQVLSVNGWVNRLIELPENPVYHKHGVGIINWSK